MKIENINITTNLLKAVSFAGGLIYVVWKMTILSVGFQEGINSRFEQLENKVEIISSKQTNQFQSVKNDRKRDSALFSNGFKDLKGEIKETQSLLIRGSFSKGVLTDNLNVN